MGSWPSLAIHQGRAYIRLVSSCRPTSRPYCHSSGRSVMCTLQGSLFYPVIGAISPDNKGERWRPVIQSSDDVYSSSPKVNFVAKRGQGSCTFFFCCSSNCLEIGRIHIQNRDHMYKSTPTFCLYLPASRQNRNCANGNSITDSQLPYRSGPLAMRSQRHLLGKLTLRHG